MRTGRPKAMLTISSDERTQLTAITRSRSLPAALTLRAKIELVCEREQSNAIVATRLGVGPHTIGKWRNRFIANRIEGLYDEIRTGRPRTVEDEAVAELITKTLARKPKTATIGACAPSPKRRELPKARFIACSNSSVCSLTVPAVLSSRPIPSLSRSCATSSGSISIRLTRLWCFASTRRAKFRPSNEPSPCFHGVRLHRGCYPRLPASWHDHLVRRPQTCSTAKSSLNANPAIATRSSSPSCVTSKLTCRTNWTSI
ncbi:hypothetical protein CI41S_21000 [Bradyrhizobium ivorense]|nr:hypothetical protein CI41S_21000 [Bradyrhizobium ivorense]